MYAEALISFYCMMCYVMHIFKKVVFIKSDTEKQRLVNGHFLATARLLNLNWSQSKHSTSWCQTTIALVVQKMGRMKIFFYLSSHALLTECAAKEALNKHLPQRDHLSKRMSAQCAQQNNNKKRNGFPLKASTLVLDLVCFQIISYQWNFFKSPK